MLMPPSLVVDLVLKYNLVIKDYYLKVRGSNKFSPMLLIGSCLTNIAICTLLGSMDAHELF